MLQYASQTKTSLTRIMLDNMVVPLPNGDVDVSMLKEAVELINGKFETEVSHGLDVAFPLIYLSAYEYCWKGWLLSCIKLLLLK